MKEGYQHAFSEIDTQFPMVLSPNKKERKWQYFAESNPIGQEAARIASYFIGIGEFVKEEVEGLKEGDTKEISIKIRDSALVFKAGVHTVTNIDLGHKFLEQIDKLDPFESPFRWHHNIIQGSLRSLSEGKLFDFKDVPEFPPGKDDEYWKEYDVWWRKVRRKAIEEIVNPQELNIVLSAPENSADCYPFKSMCLGFSSDNQLELVDINYDGDKLMGLGMEIANGMATKITQIARNNTFFKSNRGIVWPRWWILPDFMPPYRLKVNSESDWQKFLGRLRDKETPLRVEIYDKGGKARERRLTPEKAETELQRLREFVAKNRNYQGFQFLLNKTNLKPKCEVGYVLLSKWEGYFIKSKNTDFYKELEQEAIPQALENVLEFRPAVKI